jgi:hypothetical protein
MSGIQSVVFPKNEWYLTKARKWLKKHKLVPIKDVDITGTQYRFRLRDPRMFDRFATKTIWHRGKLIYLIIGFHLIPYITK